MLDHRRPTRAWRAWTPLCAVLLALPACGVWPDDAEITPAEGCPTAERAQPDPDRPVVEVDFRLEDDLRTVTGTEAVRFRPESRVEELWFRLIPNAPQSAGNRLEVTDVRGPTVTGGEHVDAGAARGTPGGLFRVDLAEPVAAGEEVAVELDFRLRLATGRTPAGFDRLGAKNGASWWASGLPLLTWEPGHGWARDPFVEVSGETTAQAVADTTIRVSAPADLEVLMTGDMAEPRDTGDGRRLWESHEPVTRDVHVAAGEFDTATVDAGGTEVTVGVAPGSGTRAEDLAEDTAEAIDLVEGRFGPFPHPTLTVALVEDDDHGGEEYSSSILLGNDDFDLVLHEVAHMWFYSLVGNSQFRDPWLDEAFASYAETVSHDWDHADEDLDIRGAVGGSMADFRDQDDYEDRVYSKGGAALVVARDEVGAEAFDEAVLCYIDTNAWAIARPEDVAESFADLPGALDVLVGAGALRPDHVAVAAD
jgi:Peptidase family M1 domain